ncbi:MAG: hypothetical protein KGR25_01080 [Chloroflexi bacterium]|nr:hypothetical protein [Chloroflexota bacterium]
MKRARKTIDRAEKRKWSARYSIADWHARLASQTEVAHLEELIQPPEVRRRAG